ncbi:putative RiPP precursor [Mesorhizobium sp. SARCC-RB16n]|nr:putative RiPP precursor [Mesorhizobium sp. SARCC-RB16n]
MKETYERPTLTKRERLGTVTAIVITSGPIKGGL